MSSSINALREPVKDSHYYIDANIAAVVESLMKHSQEGQNINLLLSGPPGSGKSSFAEQLAAKYGRKIFDVACGKMQEPSQWFGEMGYDPARGTYYRTSAFIEAISTPGTVVLLDEINRVESPKVNNTLLPVLDHRARIYVEEIGREISVAEGVIICATINEGLDFAGIDPIDLALRDRFYSIAMNYPSRSSIVKILQAKTGCTADHADQLVGVVEKATARRTMPMRDLLKAATLLRWGCGLRNAVEFGFSRGNEDHQKILQTAQQIDRDTRATMSEILWK